jgi:hypothetical protein
MDAINSLLGPGYSVLMDGGKPIIIEREMFSDLGALRHQEYVREVPKKREEEAPKPREMNMDDYVFKFYVGSLTVVGLFCLYRILEKNR